jgi:hypothetical protein
MLIFFHIGPNLGAAEKQKPCTSRLVTPLHFNTIGLGGNLLLILIGVISIAVYFV